MLDQAARAAKIVAVQDVARHMLLPTERDTLIGALKTQTTTLSETIGLQRTVVGLDRKMPVSSFTPSELDDGPLSAARRSGQLIDLSAIDTNVLRQAQRSMEAIEHHQHDANDAPKPPKPAPIDDLMDAPRLLDGRVEP
jgi:hypothetical protein